MSVPFVLGGSFSFGWVGEGGIAGTYAVVKGCAGEVGAVPESVPLGAALRVEVVEIVVGEVRGERLDVVLEGFAAECGCTGYVEGEAGCDEAGQVRGIGEGLDRFPSHLTDTISPLCISFAAAATRFGVRRLSRPSLQGFSQSISCPPSCFEYVYITDLHSRRLPTPKPHPQAHQGSRGVPFAWEIPCCLDSRGGLRAAASFCVVF